MKIDREFEKMTIPEGREALEKDILENGCREPLIIWNGILIDGHKRYAICKKYDLKYKTIKLYYETREEVIQWITDLRTDQAVPGSFACKYITGKLYLMKIRDKYKPTERGRVAEELSKRKGVNQDTIRSYGRFVNFIDRVDQSEPDFIEMVRAGKAKLGRDKISLMQGLNEEELRWKVQEIIRTVEPDRVTIRTRRKKTAEEKAAYAEMGRTIPLSMGVKNTPEYDPDTEVKSLTFTVSTWVNALARGIERIDADHASQQAKDSLEMTLRQLKKQIRYAMEVIDE